MGQAKQKAAKATQKIEAPKPAKVIYAMIAVTYRDVDLETQKPLVKKDIYENVIGRDYDVGKYLHITTATKQTTYCLADIMKVDSERVTPIIVEG